MRYRFAEFLLDLRRGSLAGPDGPVHLRPQAFRLLEVLVSRAPEMVPRDELLDRVWGTRHLSPGSLKQAISELRQALGDPHEAPRLIETVHRRGYRFIAAVAAEEPAATGPAPPPAILSVAAPAVEDRKALRGPWVRRGLAALLVLGLSLVAWRALSGWRPAPALASGPRPMAALFLYPSPAAGAADPDLAWAPTALAELLAIELASGGGVQIAGGDEVARLRRELEIDPAVPFDARGRERIRAYLGCDLLVRGALFFDGEAARLDLEVVGAQSAAAQFAGRFAGRRGDLASLARQAAARLREELLPPALAEEAGGPPWASADPAAALRRYATGLALLRGGEPVAARDQLLEAAAADPGNALVFRALAQAQQELGYLAPARAAAQRAFELSSGLPREVRLEIEGQLHLAQRDFAEAAAVYGALHRFFPDDLDHGLQLAAALAKSGEPEQAAAVLARLRLLPPPRGDHPAIDLQESGLLEAGDLRRALEMARTAARKAAARGASGLYARARRDEGWLLGRLGPLDESLAALSEAEALFRAAGDRGKVASVLATRAGVLVSRGRRPEARQLYEKAVRIAREIGNPGLEAQVLNNFAAMSSADDVPLTEALLHRSLELKIQLGDPAGEALTRLNLANFSRYEGRLAEAREWTTGALELYRRLGDKSRIAFTLRTLGAVLAKEGRLDEAAGHYQAALAAAREAGDPPGEAEAIFELGLVQLRRGDEQGALAGMRESRELYEKLGRVDDAAFSELQTGDILWARGEREAARKLYRELAARRSQLGSERVLGMLDQRLAGGPPASENPRRRGA